MSIYKIRQKVFETNSSSTHSISISRNEDTNLLDSLSINEEGGIHLAGQKFSWGVETYRDSLSKANYMMIYARDWGKTNSDKFLEILKQVIKEQTGAIDITFSTIGGYIDHQSVEMSDYDYLFNDIELLRNFIFNRSSVLETGNDNSYL